MISALFNQPNYAAAKKMLDATVLRHEAIASNLANIETPNYKRIDLAPTFQEELRQALALKSSSQIESLRPQVAMDTTAVSRKLDGNSVELETELTNLNQNFLAHTLETQLITGNLSRLRMAITGRSA
jgi:flagellar basal-body rod protein FlgB